ncbi:hypothetical protein BDV30DRAFT_238096 [Aspergillus minisclerotigenes]|uniref:Uncharacterized protein n=1 Tax=Aspergillus minisclerotigenes TaxID=656917 RepID=A0A5N6J5P1_9EURO|nr:hypothetical protein BDV30DRAFT_238096 [Aspergillus minisclerotigenes]
MGFSTRCTYVHLEDRAELAAMTEGVLEPLFWDDENFSKSARNIALVKKADGWWLEADVEQTNGAYERQAMFDEMDLPLSRRFDDPQLCSAVFPGSYM